MYEDKNASTTIYYFDVTVEDRAPKKNTTPRRRFLFAKLDFERTNARQATCVTHVVVRQVILMSEM